MYGIHRWTYLAEKYIQFIIVGCITYDSLSYVRYEVELDSTSYLAEKYINHVFINYTEPHLKTHQGARHSYPS